MTVKPGLEESLTVIGAATAGGVRASLTILHAAIIEKVDGKNRHVTERDWFPEESE